LPSSLVSDHSPLPGAPYRAPAWLPGGHLQTIYASMCAPRPAVRFHRERWDTPDGDFIDLDWLADPADHRSRVTDHGSPLVVLFHGLEGCSNSHYALALMAAVRNARLPGVVVHFRGCSGEPNRVPRAYHSGDSAELDWIVRRLRAKFLTLFAVGVSLGGNVLLKWLGETGASATAIVKQAVAVSAPVNLMAAGHALGKGFNRLYARHFLSTLCPKALDKLSRYPGLFDPARVRGARTLREFDDVVTAPLHGFKDVDDYWTRASSKSCLMHVAVSTLMINARNDPFLPSSALPTRHEVAPAVKLEQPAEGGHVGFVGGIFPGNLRWLPLRILDFFGVPRKKTGAQRS
jgi:uncharacterized protein